MEEIVRHKKAAEYLGVSDVTLYAWIRNGRIDLRSVSAGQSAYKLTDLELIKEKIINGKTTRRGPVSAKEAASLGPSYMKREEVIEFLDISKHRLAHWSKKENSPLPSTIFKGRHWYRRETVVEFKKKIKSDSEFEGMLREREAAELLGVTHLYLRRMHNKKRQGLGIHYKGNIPFYNKESVLKFKEKRYSLALEKLKILNFDDIERYLHENKDLENGQVAEGLKAPDCKSGLE